MKRIKLLVLGLAVASFLLGPAVNLPLVSAQSDEQLRQLYDNDDRFQQLSGAARTMLELKFGKKDASPGEPTAEIGANSLSGYVHSYSYVDEDDYVGNILVNDPNL